jgi:hypothetical protein
MLIKEGFLKLHKVIKKQVMYIVALYKSISINGGSEWNEESQFFELVRTDKSD